MLPLLLSGLLPPPLQAPNVIQPGRDLYPPAAIEAKLEGDVSVHLRIAIDGSMRCVAQSSDRLASLKRPSCQLIASRDIFPPRFDRQGKAVAAELDLIVRWRLKTDNGQFGGAVPVGRDYWIRHPDFPSHLVGRYAGGKVRVGFDITAMGRIEHCAVEKSSRLDAFDDAVCPLLVRRATLLPALDDKGVPRPTRGWFAVDWRDTPMTEDFTMEDGRRPLAE